MVVALTAIDVAFVGALGGCIGATAAIAAVVSTKSLAREQSTHDTEVRRSERIFAQRSRVYEIVGTAVMRIQTVIDRTFPLIGPMPEPPDDMTEDEWMLLEAQVALFGSEDLLATLHVHVDRRLAFSYAVMELTDLRESGGQADEITAARKQMEAARQAVREQTREIQRLMRDELANL